MLLDRDLSLFLVVGGRLKHIESIVATSLPSLSLSLSLSLALSLSLSLSLSRSRSHSLSLSLPLQGCRGQPSIFGTLETTWFQIF